MPSLATPKTSNYRNCLAWLKHRYPTLRIASGSRFAWSPAQQTVFIPEHTPGKDITAVWSLLHEAGHALLEHHQYQTDFELLRMELAAWERAKLLAKELSTEIDQDHIETCLDTYRDWLHRRSACPACGVHALQIDKRRYRCHNCSEIWSVSASRFCRTHRTKVTAK